METVLKFPSSNARAFGFLLSPIVMLLASIGCYGHPSSIFNYLGILLGSLFLTQAFFILHECGHLNFFRSKLINRVVGNVAGLLCGIPFMSWVYMHNLHHKWTGWRDLDPTTEKTVQLGHRGVLTLIVNLSWFCFIPIFYLTYMFSNYWNFIKIKRFTNVRIYKRCLFPMICYITVYIIFVLFFYDFVIYYFIPCFILSLIWKELVILTQHTHIDIPISEGIIVRPISYADQVKYTRSFYPGRMISKLFFLNFNYHEVHHANPGIPAYWLEQADINKTKKPTFWQWFKQAKSMSGADYIFKTSKHTGIKF